MADRTVNPHEIVLNNVKYPISGFVRERMVSQFPGKITLGDYDFSNEQILSNLIMSDQRGGMLIEEMDESIHADRYWYGTIDSRYKNALTLLPLATLLSAAPSAISSSDVTPTGHTDYSSEWANEANAYDDNWTTYAETSNTTQNAWTGYIGLDVSSMNVQRIQIKVQNFGNVAMDLEIQVYDGSYHTVVSETDVSRATTLTYDLPQRYTGATEIRVRTRVPSAQVDHYLYEVGVIEPAATSGTCNVMLEHSNQAYFAYGDILTRENSAGSGIDTLYTFPASITDLFTTSDGVLAILIGDSDEYWYMNSSDYFYETDVTNGYFGFRWDSKSWKMNSTGQWWYSTDAGAASPTWAAADASGGLDDFYETPVSIELYRNADGALIPYCACESGRNYSYDSANSKWIETEFAVTPHPETGLGYKYWDGSLFESSGLSVRKYTVGATSTVVECGLDKDDGLPALRGGSIVKFIKGDNELFTLVDSTYEGATSRSQVVIYTGSAWHVLWEATADNKNMYTGLVASDYDYRFYFSTTDGVYYITLPNTALQPKKQSGYTYAASGSHFSSYFDAATKVFKKLAVKLTLFCDDMSSNEKITAYYRTDHAYDDLATGWTKLTSTTYADGVTADGQAEFTFGTSGVGVEFYDIQFKFDFARAAGTNTNSPILLGATLSYIMENDIKKGWDFTINLAEASRVSSTPEKLHVLFATVVSTNTLMPFTFRDGSKTTDTHYIKLQSYSGYTPAGHDFKGEIQVAVIEP